MKSIHLVWSNPDDPMRELVRAACEGTTQELEALVEARRRRYPRLVAVVGQLATWRRPSEPDDAEPAG